MFDCPATSVQRDAMFDEIRSALQDVAGGAEKLRNVLSLPDASTKLLRFVSDDIYKHNGAVLPLPSAPEGRGADGVDAMA
jgi:hypothetical protein